MAGGSTTGGASEERAAIWKSLNRYAFALTCTLAILIGLVLTFQDHKLSTREVLSAVGLALLAAVIYGIIFATISTRNQERSLVQREQDLISSVETRFDTLSQKMRQDLADAARTYMPTAEYPATDSFNPIFNGDVSRSLRRSSLYAFRGTSAKYVPARLRNSPQKPQQIKIVMLNIQSERALRRRAADRNYHKSLKTSTVNDILNELKREVLMSAVALYDCRHFCPIEIAYSTETAVLRTEVFDDAVYISWYQAPKSLNTPYPESQRFVAESFLYEVQRLEIFRRFEIADHKVTFNGDSTEDDLMMHLQTISQTSVSLNEISALRAEYSDFIKPFENFLSNLQ